MVCAVAALLFAWLTAMQVDFAGFPDGHLTDYEKATDTPLRVFGYAEAGFGLLFLILALSPIKSPRRRGVALVVGLIAFVVVALVVQVGVPWYFGTHLGLDNGIGG